MRQDYKKVIRHTIEQQPHDCGSTGMAVFVALGFSAIFALCIIGWLK